MKQLKFLSKDVSHETSFFLFLHFFTLLFL